MTQRFLLLLLLLLFLLFIIEEGSSSHHIPKRKLLKGRWCGEEELDPGYRHLYDRSCKEACSIELGQNTLVIGRERLQPWKLALTGTQEIFVEWKPAGKL